MPAQSPCKIQVPDAHSTLHITRRPLIQCSKRSHTGFQCTSCKHPPRICIPACLRKVPARRHTQFQGQVLQEHGQDVANQDHKQQAVAKLGSTSKASRPVSRVPAGKVHTR